MSKSEEHDLTSNNRRDERSEKMNMKFVAMLTVTMLLASSSLVWAAYHHEGERDAEKFLQAYPNKVGTKLDHCALCHSGGSYVNSRGRTVNLGSCQWCHYSYGYDGAGEIDDTINEYGAAYKTAGRNAAAIASIDATDTDEDGYTNGAEIAANSFPGNAEDHPGLVAAPFRIYTKQQLMDLGSHTQFLLMNTSRSGDRYTQYTGIPMKDLLDNAGILGTATSITVYAPDGWAQDHPLEYGEEAESYHVYGNIPGQTYQYPQATYYYHEDADEAKNPDGWCDYSAPSCIGRSHGVSIAVDGGLKAILAYAREGAAMETGILNEENKLDGEGPFRVVVPQKVVGPPDQSSKSDNQDVKWPYNYDWDHNAGACSRSATIIKVNPLPAGTTDIDILEAGWAYVDQGKIIVYGAIDDTDTNNNGILDSEEDTGDSADYDQDGKPDYEDNDTASLMHARSSDHIILHTDTGSFSGVSAMGADESAVPQTNKPDMTFPYGVIDYQITGLTPGAIVTVTLVFPHDVPLDATYYKITAASGWQSIPFGSNDGDNVITLALTDGDAATDSDGAADGTIIDPGALAVAAADDDDDGDNDDGLCFIRAMK